MGGTVVVMIRRLHWRGYKSHSGFCELWEVTRSNMPFWDDAECPIDENVYVM